MRLPRHRIWEILPGVNSFLNCNVGVSGGKGVLKAMMESDGVVEGRERGGGGRERGRGREDTFAGMSYQAVSQAVSYQMCMKARR